VANAKLLRALLTHVMDHPSLLDLTTYAEHRPSGDIVADLPGRALLESRWTLVADKTFRSPDGEREICEGWAIEDEAQALLDVTDDDLWAGRDLECLFTITDNDEAVRRLTALTEAAEAVTSNA
jgi:hypothetical protein